MNFSSELQKLTGESSTQISATNYRDMINELTGRYPRLSRETLSDMAVAIDGVIIVDPLLEPLAEDAEVHFLHFVAGG